MENKQTLHSSRPHMRQQTRAPLVVPTINLQLSRNVVIGSILLMALLAFEMFNFDTTRYALTDLLGEVHFFGIHWATILAIAFCSIDFAGLIRLFTPEQGREEPKAVWYLMGAWLLGATMNAMMTWWAISLTLLNHELGNEILSREQLLQWAPIFVATLVWLTRILFIGAFSVAGEHIFDLAGARPQPGTARHQAAAQRAAALRTAAQRSAPVQATQSGMQPARVRRQQRPVRTVPTTAVPQPLTPNPAPPTLVTTTNTTPEPEPMPAPRRERRGPQRPMPSQGRRANAYNSAQMRGRR